VVAVCTNYFAYYKCTYAQHSTFSSRAGKPQLKDLVCSKSKPKYHGQKLLLTSLMQEIRDVIVCLDMYVGSSRASVAETVNGFTPGQR